MAGMSSDKKSMFKREKGYFESLLWAVVFFLIIVNVALKIVSDYWDATVEYNSQRDLQAVHDFADAKQDTDLSIFLIGTSRLRHALNQGFSPTTPVKLPDGRTVTMMTIGVDSASFSSFDHVTEDVLAADPDYLVIERHLLINDSRVGGEKMTSTLWVLMAIDGFIDRAIVRRVSREEEWEISRKGHYIDCLTDFSKPLLDKTLAYNQERDFYDLEGDEPQATRDFIRRARAQGIKVIIIFFAPHTEELEKYGYPLHYLDVASFDHDPTKEELLPEQSDEVKWWFYWPREEKASQFCDFTHYNDKGRNLSTQWFINRVMKLDDKL